VAPRRGGAALGLRSGSAADAISVLHRSRCPVAGRPGRMRLEEPEEARDPRQAGGDVAEAAVPQARRRGGDGLLDRLRDVRDLEDSGGHTRTVPPRQSRSNAAGSTPAMSRLDSCYGQARLMVRAGSPPPVGEHEQAGSVLRRAVESSAARSRAAPHLDTSRLRDERSADRQDPRRHPRHTRP
jgi:hypothetical protein